jgi:ribonuclease P protein component
MSIKENDPPFRRSDLIRSPGNPGLFIFVSIMPGKKINTLGREERLKSRKQIRSLFEKGEKIVVFPCRALYEITPNEAPALKAGFSVSARHFPKAVDRNRIKRLLREAYRLQKGPLQQRLGQNKLQAGLFFIYNGRELPDLLSVRKSVGQILNKLLKRLHEPGTENI